MIKVHCRTNLDLVRGAEKWPEFLPAIPHVGDKIQSAQIWSGGFQLELTVIQVTWKKSMNLTRGEPEWYPEIELHCPNKSIREFYQWYAPLVGRRLSDFI